MTTVDPDTFEVPVPVIAAVDLILTAETVDMIAVEFPEIVAASVEPAARETVLFPEIVTAPVISCSPEEFTCAPTVES